MGTGRFLRRSWSYFPLRPSSFLSSVDVMASAGRIVRAVKVHVPLIKFPNRKTFKAERLTPAAVSQILQKESTMSASSEQNSKPPVGYTPRGSGIEWTELPLKYQKKPIPLEEMEFIERGGPL